MAYETYQGSTQDEQELVSYLMPLFASAQLHRVNFESMWEEAAMTCLPEYRGTFSFGNTRTPGLKQTQFQVDSTGAIASHRFMAIFDAMVTPFNSQWSEVRAADPYLQKQKAARAYYQEVTRIVWGERYRAVANFHGQNQQNGQCLGVFGNMGMLIDELDRKPSHHPAGLRYMATSPGEIYILQNHQGAIDGFIRSFRWTARQAAQRWPHILTDDKYLAMKTALETGNSFQMFDFLQFVLPRTDYDPHQIFAHQSKPWVSLYVGMAGRCILEQNGYHSFPLAYGRYSQAPDEWYGRGWAQMAGPELKTLNAEKEAFLKAGVMGGDPSYLLPPDDGLFTFQAGAGQNIYGGMNEDGRPLVGVLPAGNIQITKEMMDESRKTIYSASLNDLFPLLFDQRGPQRSAREVVEMAIQQGIFLSPLARQYTEYCAPIVEREIDLLARMRNKLPPVPDVIKEAGDNNYETQFTSPLAQALDMPAIGGFMRTVEMASEVAQATGDRSVFYHFAFKRALPEIAVNQRVPEDWMSTAQEVAAQEKAAADAIAEENRVKRMPGEAAIAKAEAIQAKAATGGNTGGTLSGTPEGGMPMMPQNTEPGGRAFGSPGRQS